ncbi:hypothetical protein ACQKWADRAFT_41055 [Trichoderma austrokoningii]
MASHTTNSLPGDASIFLAMILVFFCLASEQPSRSTHEAGERRIRWVAVFPMSMCRNKTAFSGWKWSTAVSKSYDHRLSLNRAGSCHSAGQACISKQIGIVEGERLAIAWIRAQSSLLYEIQELQRDYSTNAQLAMFATVIK